MRKYPSVVNTSTLGTLSPEGEAKEKNTSGRAIIKSENICYYGRIIV